MPHSAARTASPRLPALLLIGAAAAALHPPAASAQTPLFPPDKGDPSARPVDVLHYRIAVDLRGEAERTIEATTTITLVSLADRPGTVTLDAVDLAVTAVRRERPAPAGALRFTAGPRTLAIHPDPPPRAGDTLVFSVRYTAKPAAGLYFLGPDSSNPFRRRQIWTQGQETDNPRWFPCNDRNADKATSEVVATVRSGLTVLSNGRLVGVREDPAAHSTTFHWRQSAPHSAYLVALVAGEYAVLRDTVSGVPLLTYSYPDRTEDTRRALGRTPAMFRFLERTLQVPYPWEKYAQAVIADFMWGGMENTSAVTLNEDVMIGSRDSLDYTPDATIVHELAHMWVGNLVTCRDWSHMWLNEGYANYLEELYGREARGEEVFALGMHNERTAVVEEERRSGDVPLVGPENYGGFVYAKGAWLLHMLSGLVGEEAFLRATRAYVRTFAFSVADTHEFQRAVEDATGHRLGWFFRQWAYTGGHPVVTIGHRWDAGTGRLLIRIAQRNSADSAAGPFRFPLPLSITGGSSDTSFTAWISTAETTLAVPRAEPPALLVADPHVTLLATIRHPRTVEEFILQLARPRPGAARLEAADSLLKHAGEPAVFRALAEAARRDPLEAVRHQALRGVAAAGRDTARQVLLEALRDSSALVRRGACRALGEHTGPEVEAALIRLVDEDPSNGVLTEALAALAAVNPSQARPRIRAALGVESWRHWVRRTALGLLRRFPDSTAVPDVLPFTRPGYPEDMRLAALACMGAAGRSAPPARDAVALLLGDSDPDMRSAAAGVLGQWKDGPSITVLEHRLKTEPDEEVRRNIERALALARDGEERSGGER